MEILSSVKEDGMDKNQIRTSLLNLKGKPVKLYAVGERNKILNAQGILDGVYSDVFTVLVDKQGYMTRYSYTYSEILTSNVQVRPVS